ncbi:MarR family winged helix-turn-helix transcriptional regulator [Limosilactobacillus kribbianus]|uniref:MarR family winged helix-turn-helix transcriptional regulator n=1 Tax=Limosilactobacillus kribbianus TaxID=2982695 RepID=UPI0022649D75|nr:MarR family transcriptional regulator [Limosilactobacillus kribbianus]
MKQAAVDEITELIKSMRASHGNPHGSQEQRWITAHLNDDELAGIVANLSIVALHILSALEKGEMTGIELADSLSVTRGGVSRAAKKLLHYDLVKAGKHPDDQKKIYYSITARGQKMARVHDQMHLAIKKMIAEKLVAKYSEQELTIVAEFLRDFNQLEGEFN